METPSLTVVSENPEQSLEPSPPMKPKRANTLASLKYPLELSKAVSNVLPYRMDTHVLPNSPVSNIVVVSRFATYLILETPDGPPSLTYTDLKDEYNGVYNSEGYYITSQIIKTALVLYKAHLLFGNGPVSLPNSISSCVSGAPLEYYYLSYSISGCEAEEPEGWEEPSSVLRRYGDDLAIIPYTMDTLQSCPVYGEMLSMVHSLSLKVLSLENETNTGEIQSCLNNVKEGLTSMGASLEGMPSREGQSERSSLYPDLTGVSSEYSVTKEDDWGNDEEMSVQDVIEDNDWSGSVTAQEGLKKGDWYDLAKPTGVIPSMPISPQASAPQEDLEPQGTAPTSKSGFLALVERYPHGVRNEHERKEVESMLRTVEVDTLNVELYTRVQVFADTDEMTAEKSFPISYMFIPPGYRFGQIRSKKELQGLFYPQVDYGVIHYQGYYFQLIEGASHKPFPFSKYVLLALPRVGQEAMEAASLHTLLYGPRLEGQESITPFGRGRGGRGRQMEDFLQSTNEKSSLLGVGRGQGRGATVEATITRPGGAPVVSPETLGLMKESVEAQEKLEKMATLLKGNIALGGSSQAGREKAFKDFKAQVPRRDLLQKRATEAAKRDISAALSGGVTSDVPLDQGTLKTLSSMVPQSQSSIVQTAGALPLFSSLPPAPGAPGALSAVSQSVREAPNERLQRMMSRLGSRK